jgi:uncharacterized membrane protein YgcG
VVPGAALKLIQGKYSSTEFDPWKDLVKPVIHARDGAEAANSESNDRNSFWSDHNRLVLAKPIMTAAMNFTGNKGRSAGSYLSFHEGMCTRARKVKGLPSNFLKKDGLTKKLGQIGCLVMTAQASREKIMIVEPLGTTHIRTPFFPAEAGSLATTELALFDSDLVEARSKARLHEEYGDDEDGNFRTNKKRRKEGGQGRWQDDDVGNRDNAVISPGTMLAKWSVYLTKKGPIYGYKYLVAWGQQVTPDQIPHDTCLGALCHLSHQPSRRQWCNKLTCAHHRRPAPLAESDFHIINIHAADNNAADKAVAAEVVADKANWVHWGGPANYEVLGGIAGAPYYTGSGNNSGRAGSSGRGNGFGGGRGKGKGGGKGGKGSKGGKGRKGRGGPSNFGRQH